MSDLSNDSERQWRIALVDDDVAVLRALARMLTLRGYSVTTFNSAEEFLATVEQYRPEMVLLDLRMPKIDGLALQSLLVDRGVDVPIVFLSGHGDVATSVRAIRGGAVDFLEKPCDESTLLASLDRAAEVARRDRSRRSTLSDLTNRANSLTRRELEVFRLVVTGRLNKQIAAALGTTEKTIKVHRARVMTKMRAESITDLVRMFDSLSAVPAALLERSETAQRSYMLGGESSDDQAESLLNGTEL
jgi:FixJ family two-component response regulator